MGKEQLEAHDSYSPSESNGEEAVTPSEFSRKEEKEETSNDIDQLKEKQVVTQFELSKKED